MTPIHRTMYVRKILNSLLSPWNYEEILIFENGR